MKIKFYRRDLENLEKRCVVCCSAVVSFDLGQLDRGSGSVFGVEETPLFLLVHTFNTRSHELDSSLASGHRGFFNCTY